MKYPTPHSRILDKKLYAFYETRQFITVFTTAPKLDTKLSQLTNKSDPRSLNTNPITHISAVLKIKSTNSVEMFISKRFNNYMQQHSGKNTYHLL
jgi:hypothetical protein